MFQKFTHKDLLLIAGIVVAMLVALSVILFDNPSNQEAVRDSLPRINTPAAKVIVQKISDGFLGKF